MLFCFWPLILPSLVEVFLIVRRKHCERQTVLYYFGSIKVIKVIKVRSDVLYLVIYYEVYILVFCQRKVCENVKTCAQLF